MIDKKTYLERQKKVVEYFEKAKIAITEEEKQKIEIADFGLNDLDKSGLQLITYINTDRVCSKEMVLFPRQTCPEHLHPTIGNNLGKEETFRCRYGRVYLYVSGEKSNDIKCTPPNDYYSVFKQIILDEGEQYTIYPDTFHWFQAGDKGAVISEFSTTSHDETDIFTDPNITRIPEIEE